MVQYSFAVATLVAAILSSADGSFISSSHQKTRPGAYGMETVENNNNNDNRGTSARAFASQSWRRQQRLGVLSVSAAFNNERDNNKNNNNNSFLKSNISDSDEDEFVDEYEMEMERRKQARAAYSLLTPNTNSDDGTATRTTDGSVGKSIRYEIELPLLVAGGSSLWKPVEGVKPLAAPDDVWISQRVGASLKEISTSGELSELALDLDSLRYQTRMEESIRDTQRSTPSQGAGSIQLLNIDELDSPPGLIVSSVVRGGLAWNAGVRVGDQLLASSATLGEKLWAKSTMEGVRSAVSSRKVMSSKIKFELQRPAPKTGQTTIENFATEQFTIQLSRPMGINVEDTEEGFVRVTGLTDQALESTKKAIQSGDRILAVNTSFGKQMWPVSSVEGLVSACTTRLLGQPVTLRLERLVDKSQTKAATDNTATSDESDNTVYNVDSFRQSQSNELKVTAPSKADTSLPKIADSTGVEKNESQRMLLSRCGDILKRYISIYNPSSAEKEQIVAVPSLVADRVLDAIADASISMDAKTLTLLMNAYLICGKEDEAIRVFEAATGLSPNGDATATSNIIIQSKKNKGCQLVADSEILDLYAATALLRAHAMRKDCLTANNILMAMQGYDNMNDKSNAWAKYTSADLKPDIRCYNIVLAAAARAGGQQNLSIALDLFESLSDSSTPSNKNKLPKKNVVTYNTMIAAYANAGKRQDAYTIFNSMRKADIMPDKYTITSLIKAYVNDGDLESAKTLLKNMRKAKIEVDLYAYNTVIKALCENMKWYEAKELVTEMEFRGVKPDGMTYGLLMNGLLKAGQPGPCLTLFEAACADQSTVALTENVRLYTTAITAAATLGDHERALELVSRMRFSGVQPNIKTLTSLMGACISGKKPDLALDVFKKIKNPDGYCQSLAIRAYCDIKDFESASQFLQKESNNKSELSGKQLMASYKYILNSSLKKGRYDIARESMESLLGAGFIPSKKIYKAMLDGLDLLPKKGSKGKNVAASNVTDNEDKFDFLLAILDMIDARNLQFDCDTYAALLFEGSRLGGLRKKIGSFVAERRTDSSNESNQIEVDTKIVNGSHKTKISWQKLIENYSEYKDRLDDFILPTTQLRLGERDIRLVLAAEKGVIYQSNRRKSFSGKTKRR